MAYNIDWKYKRDIKCPEDLQYFIDVFTSTKPKVLSIDTETTGLHIIKDKPFLISFGFYTNKKVGYTFTYDFEYGFDTYNVMRILYKACSRCDKVVLHNTKFDLHMLSNIGYPYPHKNITDSQIFIRLTHDAIPINQGGAPLSLKQYAKQYIDPNANRYEQDLKAEIRQIHAQNNMKLKERLKGFILPDKFKVSGKEKSWTKGVIDNFLKDSINESTDLPKEVQEQWLLWKSKDYIEPTYDKLNREKVTIYAHYDIIFTLEIYDRCEPLIVIRKQEKTLQLEEDLILPLYRMESVGFAFNYDYAMESKQRVRNYIIEKRKILHDLAGEEVSVGQHQRLAEIFTEKYNTPTTSCNDGVLNEIISNTNLSITKLFAETIQELRTLEKWYSTYILKWIDAAYEGRIYTQISQSGAASGRVSSDFQQFPGKGLYDSNRNELFQPRRLVKVTGGDYHAIAYLDYSQIELRFQAMYTIFVSGGDTNLCRAYMPFNCYRLDEMNNQWAFNYDNPDDIKNFNNYTWYHNEDNIEWHPVDLHGATTKEAYNIDESHPDFKQLRKHGKTTNFACNYGATDKTLHAQGFDWDTAKSLYDGYKRAFPKIQDYRNYVTNFLKHYPYIENLFGRKYYGANDHKCCNYLIQGSAADFLKTKIIEVDKFLIENKYKSRFQMNIHDEMSFEIYRGEEHIIYDIQKIMQDLPGTKVPIVADLEITYTTWDEKEDM